MKKILCHTSLFLVLSAAVTGFAQAEDNLSIIPSIGYQQKELKFEQTFTAGAENGRHASFDVQLPTVNVSLTTIYQKFYMALKYEKNIVDTGVDVFEIYHAYGSPFGFMNNPGETTAVAREDASITMGYNVWRSLNLFLGYTEGKTNLTPSPGCLIPLGGTTCTVRNAAFWHQAYGLSPYEQTYTEKGPYLGASYSWSVADKGSFSISTAYADMNGRYEDNYSPVPNADFAYEGDATGVSFGMTWSAPLGESSSYFLDLRKQKYSMKGVDANGNFPNSAVNTTERLFGLTAGLQFFY